jgi:hypothetical protein
MVFYEAFMPAAQAPHASTWPGAGKDAMGLFSQWEAETASGVAGLSGRLGN